MIQCCTIQTYNAVASVCMWKLPNLLESHLFHNINWYTNKCWNNNLYYKNWSVLVLSRWMVSFPSHLYITWFSYYAVYCWISQQHGWPGARVPVLQHCGGTRCVVACSLCEGHNNVIFMCSFTYWCGCFHLITKKIHENQHVIWWQGTDAACTQIFEKLEWHNAGHSHHWR